MQFMEEKSLSDMHKVIFCYICVRWFTNEYWIEVFKEGTWSGLVSLSENDMQPKAYYL